MYLSLHNSEKTGFQLRMCFFFFFFLQHAGLQATNRNLLHWHWKEQPVVLCRSFSGLRATAPQTLHPSPLHPSPPHHLTVPPALPPPEKRQAKTKYFFSMTVTNMSTQITQNLIKVCFTNKWARPTRLVAFRRSCTRFKTGGLCLEEVVAVAPAMTMTQVQQQNLTSVPACLLTPLCGGTFHLILLALQSLFEPGRRPVASLQYRDPGRLESKTAWLSNHSYWKSTLCLPPQPVAARRPRTKQTLE